jgi:phospholipid/cholesterol/gamma-HCH transport system ATP-binding protein
MIELKDISKKFGEKMVLENISAAFEKGKTNLVIGGSGSGKTVLMKCMVGLLEVDSGEVFFDSRNFSSLNFRERKPFRQEIGMVFQGGALFDSQNVERNVMFPLSMFTDMPDSEKRDRANDCLKRVNLINVNKLFPSELSGGMKKRVAIARAIAPTPKYLFFDEPNSGLDPQTAILIDNLIKEITEEYQTTTVINTHDMNSVMEIGDKIIFLHKGHKWWEGSNREITTSNNKELKEFIFASKILRELVEKN